MSALGHSPSANPSETAPLAARLADQLGQALGEWPSPLRRSGRLQHAVGPLLSASGIRAQVGELCHLASLQSPEGLMAEVVGFQGDLVLMSPLGTIEGLSLDTQVTPTGEKHQVPVGDFVLGRVLDGMGTAFLDDGPAMPTSASRRRVMGTAPAALTRRPITQPLPVGLRAVDGLLTCGIGQRVGIFAPAGCGKSTLLSMLCRHAQADVIVMALVGERGREVVDFIHESLGPAAMSRAVLVVSTSDRPATERLKAAFVATTHAEYFAAQGKRVLLLVDSVTRVARAAREIGLAAGEPPARRGFPPSVFTLLPQLFERAGCLAQGAITAFYTVLEETDDGADPVSEEVRSLLDGHIVLSRKLAGKGHFPAVDVLQSTSRLQDRLADAPHMAAARRLREMLTKLDDIDVLLRIGEYRPGTDALADLAIARRDAIEQFLQQPPQAVSDFQATLAALATLTHMHDTATSGG